MTQPQLTIYDLSTDKRHVATQADIDAMQKMIAAVATKSVPKLVVTAQPGFDFKLAVYLNPMRDDGVFVAELKDIQPYNGILTHDGRPTYPAMPDTPWCIRSQLPKPFAEELVRRWNYFKS